NPHERVIKNLYEPLVGYKPGTIDLVGILAESWEYSPDGKALTFKLRAGVKFHDGTQLDAEAVRLSFQRVLDLGLARASYLRPVESFET
ncbi:MAG: ABC transporter substrate-binding protein, partial [Desulfitobacteriaceae bacterium]|nr:ABC transporter substrate-binding protein [Desulfitobacteriaceae bacterium]